MKIFELEQTRVANTAVDAIGGGIIGASIRRAVINFMTSKGAQGFKQRMARQAVPGIGLALGLVFAYHRYKTQPNDYIGIGLDIASGVAGLGTALALIPVQLARDAWTDVIKDLQAAIAAAGGQTSRPEILTLKGSIERDTVTQPALVKELMSSIAAEIKEQVDISLDQVKEWEKLSQPERNAEIQKRADAISPEAGAAQMARAAATDRMNRAAKRTPPK